MGILDRGRDAGREASRAGTSIRRRVAGERSGPGWIGAGLIGLAAGVAGALVAFVTDPQRGRARRAQLLDQGAATMRRAGRQAGRTIRNVTTTAQGKMQEARYAGTNVPPVDDVTLRDRAETQLFRDPSVPKGGINLSVERGILVLRGEVPDAATRDQLVREAEKVEGVWSVRNMLHLPGEPIEELAATAGR